MKINPIQNEVFRYEVIIDENNSVITDLTEGHCTCVDYIANRSYSNNPDMYPRYDSQMCKHLIACHVFNSQQWVKFIKEELINNEKNTVTQSF